MTKVQRTCVLLALAAGLVASAAPAQAYIGPGAGFALLSSFLVVFVTILLAIVSVLTDLGIHCCDVAGKGDPGVQAGLKGEDT